MSAEPTAPYWPYYCEENAWHAAQRCLGEAGPVEVWLVSNRGRTCALWAQRAAPAPDEPVLWDYHVVVRAGGYVLDPDCTAGARLAAEAWLTATFPHAASVRPRFRPAFRVLDAARYLTLFASDRRHMRDAAGVFQQPPPPWPPRVAADGALHTLPALLAFDAPTSTADALPAWRSLKALREHLALSARPSPTP